MYATIRQRSEDERRLLVLIGMAAGLSAIFRSPIGSALFAIEVLYSDMEFEAGALLYTLLAAVVAYALNGLVVGWHPLFQVPAVLPPPTFLAYGGYVLLGLASGLVATLLPWVFYGLRDVFRRLPVPLQVQWVMATTTPMPTTLWRYKRFLTMRKSDRSVGMMAPPTLMAMIVPGHYCTVGTTYRMPKYVITCPVTTSLPGNCATGILMALPKRERRSKANT